MSSLGWFLSQKCWSSKETSHSNAYHTCSPSKKHMIRRDFSPCLHIINTSLRSSLQEMHKKLLERRTIWRPPFHMNYKSIRFIVPRWLWEQLKDSIHSAYFVSLVGLLVILSQYFSIWVTKRNLRQFNRWVQHPTMLLHGMNELLSCAESQYYFVVLTKAIIFKFLCRSHNSDLAGIYLHASPMLYKMWYVPWCLHLLYL